METKGLPNASRWGGNCAGRAHSRVAPVATIARHFGANRGVSFARSKLPHSIIRSEAPTAESSHPTTGSLRLDFRFLELTARQARDDRDEFGRFDWFDEVLLETCA